MPSESLINYLSVPGEPFEPDERALAWKPMTNRRDPETITELVSWPEFSYETIIQEYGFVLNEQFEYEESLRFPRSSQKWFPNKGTLQYFLVEQLVFHVHSALKSTFNLLASTLSERNLVPISFQAGYYADPIKTYSPDMSFMAVPLNSNLFPGEKGPNQLPGDLKCSWKWKSAWGKPSADEMQKRFYRLELSRIQLYMDKCGTRYGFILTDEELVAIKRDDTSGRLALSEPIPWTSGGPGKMSVSLAVWYLGMLAAKPDWSLKEA